jgi:hypothetical protein
MAMRRQARIDWALRRVRAGREPGYWLSTVPVRAHIENLRAQGWTFERIGRAAGVAPSSVWRALTAAHMRATISNAILAVPASALTAASTDVESVPHPVWERLPRVVSHQRAR